MGGREGRATAEYLDRGLERREDGREREREREGGGRERMSEGRREELQSNWKNGGRSMWRGSVHYFGLPAHLCGGARA